jgi:hypothetical protein
MTTGKCPHCSFSPTRMSDYCDVHRPKIEGRMKRPSYRSAVAWIARNDNAYYDRPVNSAAEENVAGYISTCLVADLFGIDPKRVAKDVMRLRKEIHQ